VSDEHGTQPVRPTLEIRRQRKTSERVARDLAGQIVEQNLAPGTRLPNERQMTESFGIGRTTLREALRLLETRGVITIKPGPRGGPVVRRPRPADLGEALTLMLEFERSTLDDIMHARAALEPACARLAADRITAADVDVLQSTIDRTLADPHNHAVFMDATQGFHSHIAVVAGNAVLGVFTDTLKSVTDGVLAGVRYTPNRRRAVALAHQPIVDALQKGDADAAVAAMSQHLLEARRYWSRTYAELLAQPVRWSH